MRGRGNSGKLLINLVRISTSDIYTSKPGVRVAAASFTGRTPKENNMLFRLDGFWAGAAQPSVRS